MQLGDCDAYVNLAGGMKVQEPAIDLGIVMAIASSFKNRSIPKDMTVFGEVGLSGEVRAVGQAEQRVQEAVKLGFKTVVLPQSNLTALKDSKIAKTVKLIGVSSVQDAIDLI